MVETLHPGTFVIEKPQAAPLEAIGTSAVSIVGDFLKGTLNKAILVTSLPNFQLQYGGAFTGSVAPDSVEGFFLNGGTQAFVVRASRTAPVSASFIWLDTLTDPVFTVTAVNEGAWGNSIDLTVATGTLANTFKLTVTDNISGTPEIVETYDNVVLTPTTSEDYIETVTANSDFIVISAVDGTKTPELITNTLAAGDNGSGNPDFVGVPASKTGLHALDEVTQFTQFIIPDDNSLATVTAAVAFAESVENKFFIFSTTAGTVTAGDAVTEFTGFSVASKFAVFYTPQINVPDRLSNISGAVKLIPSDGHIAGIYARTDKQRGVHKAPAGIEAKLNGVVSLEVNYSDADQDILNPNKINALRNFPDAGLIVFGARMTAANRADKYIAVRRNITQISQTLLTQTRWVIFEPNNNFLYARIKSVITNFLLTKFNEGALFGNTPEEAFYVIVDETINTTATIEQGKVFAKVGIRPVQTAEFFIIDLAQWDGGASATVS